MPTSAHKEPTEFSPKEVIDYYDNDGKLHTAILMRTLDNGKRSVLLFLTSNPKWNKQSRQISKEELAFLGFPHKRNRPTYFAPVVRDNLYFIKTDRPAISQDFWERLCTEFNINK